MYDAVYLTLLALTSLLAEGAVIPRAPTNYQTFSGAVGGIAAPAVTYSSGQWYQSGQAYGAIYTALQQSCYSQASTCSSSLAWPTSSACWADQVNACLSAATTISSAYTASAAASASSVASANFAAATQARAKGDLQTYTRALGGAAAPAVSGSGTTYYVAGDSAVYYYLINALQSSCYKQEGACNNLIGGANAGPEMTVYNCDTVQINACLDTAQNIVNGATSSAAPTSSSTVTNGNSITSASIATSSIASPSLSSTPLVSTSIASASALSASMASASMVSASIASASALSASIVSASAASASIISASALSASIASASIASASAALVSIASASASSASAASIASASALSVSLASASRASSASVASASMVSASAASASVASASAYSASIASVASASAASVASIASASTISASAASASIASVSAYAASIASMGSVSALSASIASASRVSAASVASASILSASVLSASIASASVASASAAAATASTLTSGWTVASQSCVAEGTSGRALTGASLSSNTMTYKLCTDFCANNGFPIAAVEYSSQCFCGGILMNGASLNIASTNCNMGCSGSGSTICGGPNALTVFVNTAGIKSLTSDLTSKVVTLPSGWSATSTACIAEGLSGRALTAASTSSSSMTAATCINYCSGLGYQFAGVEYSSECYCGSALSNGASLSLPSTNCNMLCSGDSSSTCGGGSALQLYTNPALAPVPINGFSSQGCIQEVGGRALTGGSTVSASMTIEKCTTFCSAAGFHYAGVEYGQECYCGNSLVNGGSLSLSSGQCNMACAGNAGQICGGPNAINLYYSSTVSTPAVASGPVAPASVNGYRSQGCIQEVPGRALAGGGSTTGSSMTIESCIAYCNAGGYTYAGLEYASECYCSNGLVNGASLSKTSSSCNMACSGNPAQLCGGPNAINLYSTR